MSSLATRPIDSVGARLWDVASTVGTGPLGAGRGIREGYLAYKAGQTAVPSLLPVAGEGSIATIVHNFLRNFFGNFFAGGLSGIKNSGVLGEIGKAFTKLEFGGLSNALSKVGGKGLVLLGAHGLIAGTAIIGGFMLAWNAYKRFSDAKTGWSLEAVQNPTVHLLQALAGAATGIGGLVALFVNPAVGLATIAAGFGGSLAMDGVKYAIAGDHWFNYPRTALYPFNKIFNTFRNPGADTGYV